MFIDNLSIIDRNFYEYIQENVLVHSRSALLFIATLFVLHSFLTIFNMKSSTKYALVHFIVNMYVTYGTFTDTVNVFMNPYDIEHVSNYISLVVVILHIYHIAFYFKTIKIDELIHHIWIVFIILPITWLSYVNLANVSLFFMSGFPGGITYILLVLKDFSVITSLQEKYISKHLGMWIRMPGAIIVGYIIILQCAHQSTIGIVLLSICAAGCFWNGIYFASTIIESYNTAKIKLL